MFLKGADRDRLSELAEILVESSTDAELPILPANDEMRIIRWLAGYRFTRFRLPDDVERQVRMCCSLPQTIPEAVARAAMTTSYDEPSIRANLYSQMWRRSIQVADDRRELSDATSVCAS